MGGFWENGRWFGCSYCVRFGRDNCMRHMGQLGVKVVISSQFSSIIDICKLILKHVHAPIAVKVCNMVRKE